MANKMKVTLKTCNISGITTSEDNFYRNQNHVKAVDNVRRLTGATNRQLTNLFNQLYTY
jgi:uridine phosphorylase